MKFDLIYTLKQPAWPGSEVSSTSRRLEVIEGKDPEEARQAVKEFLAKQGGEARPVSLTMQDEIDPKINYLSEQASVPKQLISLFRTFAMQEEELKLSEEPVLTGAKCRFPGCSGDILRAVSRKYFGDPMHAIIGPGYKNQLTAVVTMYCSHCGVRYEKLPTT